MIQAGLNPGAFFINVTQDKRKVFNQKGHHNGFKKETCSSRKSDLQNARLAYQLNFYQKSKLKKLLQMVYQRVRQYSGSIYSTNNPQTMVRPPNFKISSCGADFLSCTILTKQLVPAEGRINERSVLYWNFIIKFFVACVPKCVTCTFFYDQMSQKSCLQLPPKLIQILPFISVWISVKNSSQ